MDSLWQVRVYASKETTACLAESGRVFTWGQSDELEPLRWTRCKIDGRVVKYMDVL